MQTFFIFPPVSEKPKEQLLEDLLNSEMVAIDTETTGLVRWKDLPVFWSVAYRQGKNIFRAALEAKDLFFFDPFWKSSIPKIFHNAGFDLAMLANAGIKVSPPYHDTMILDALIDEVRPHGLKECAWDYFGIQMPHYPDLFKKRDIRQISLSEISDYASKDAYVTLLLFEYLRRESSGEKISENRTVWDLYNRYYVPFIETIFKMNRRGVLLDQDYLLDLRPLIEEELILIVAAFNDAAQQASVIKTGRLLEEYEEVRGEKHREIKPVFPDGKVNLNSTPQLRFFFFDILGRKIEELTSGGTSGNRLPALTKKILKKWAKDGCGYSQTILEYRRKRKILSTYIDGLLKRLSPRGRIHTTFKIMGTRTGRLTSSEPNLQNQVDPKNDPYQIRRAFIAPLGKKLIVADYKTLEMRIMAHFSNCSPMIQAIREGQDLHSVTAAMMMGVNYEDILWAKKNEHNEDLSVEEKGRVNVLLKQRKAAKTIGFGIIYGMQEHTLAERLGCSVEEAAKLRNSYFETFPEVKIFMDNMIRLCRAQGYVQTWLGRKRRLPEINSRNHRVRSEAERMAINTPIQGTAADIVQIAMLKCDRDPALRSLDCSLILQIHDELVFEVPEENVEKCVELIRHNMETPFAEHFHVPMEVEIGVGKNWMEAK